MASGARALVTLVALLLLTACSGDPAPTEPGPSPTVPSVDPFEVEVGDCVDTTAGSGEITEVPVVPCSQAHVGEAYEVVRMAGDGVFPGDQAVIEAARGCEQPFEEFVGVELAVSQLMVTYFHPTAQSWETGDREILCIVSDPVGMIEGSLLDANR